MMFGTGVVLCLGSSFTRAGGAELWYDITMEGQTIRLDAGILQRTITRQGSNVSTTALKVDGHEILAGEANEASFTIHFAEPNSRPKGIRPGAAAGGVEAVENTAADITDALIVKKGEGFEVKQSVKWVEPVSVTGRTWDLVFDVITYRIIRDEPGKVLLNIRARATRENRFFGMSADLFYEIYEGQPVIRKWMEIRNNSPCWIKVDSLLIEDLSFTETYRHRTDCTPAINGTTASVAALGTQDGALGVIAVNEIPSALRMIRNDGGMGYADEFFEWVLGPSERFVSEPVFYYAYAGEVIPTVSVPSTPRDRTIEGPYMRFMEKTILLSVDFRTLPAPMWCSWANYNTNINDGNMRQAADLALEVGLAGIQLDAGWGRTNDWAGSATVPNPEKFPDFDATCRYIREKGLHLGLWTSCIRREDEKDFRALPEAAVQPPIKRGGLGMSFASNWRDYFADDIVYLHDRYGMVYMKQDLSNIFFGDIAEGHESRTQKESHLRGLRGLLESQRDIHRRAPEIVTLLSHEILWDTPGPGADVASLKSAVSYHTAPNDYGGAGDRYKRVGPEFENNKRCDPKTMQEKLLASALNCRKMLYAHRGLPLYRVEYLGASMVHYKGTLTPEIQDRQICSWLVGIPNVWQGDLASLTPTHIARYRKRFDLLKRLQETYGIYGYFQFSGVPEPTETDWHWWGKLNEEGGGAVVILRGTQGADQRNINIPWVKTRRQYNVSAWFSEKVMGTFTGKQLQDGELALALPAMGQEILELAPTTE